MTPRIRSAIIIASLLCAALPAWSQQYLYTPQPFAAGQQPAAQNGILVEEIQIKKGDTLHDLSRKFSGRGAYYPQILLFNAIKNPDLIRTGETLRVPVTEHGAPASDVKPAAARKKNAGAGKKSAAKAGVPPSAAPSSGPVQASDPAGKLYLSDLTAGSTGKARTVRHKKKTVVQTEKRTPHPKIAAPAAEATVDQKLYEAAVKAYRTDDFRTALELFEQYLAHHSGSPLAADAQLYKAECYLKLSAQ